MMQKVLILIFVLLLALPAGAQKLPVLYLNGTQLNYAFARAGTLETMGESYAVTVKYRGTYSASFTGKRNYSLHLKNEDGTQRKASLLGLRQDDDYVLLGALSDPSRLRNAIGLSLWRELGYPAPACAACELYFSGYYKGLYFLFERPDRKSAGVPKDGALYRVLCAAADGANALTDAVSDAPRGETWYNIGKRYPDTDDGWAPLLQMLEAPEKYLDLSAFADYYLFVNLTGASDNLEKNLFLCWDGARFYPMPWDMDAAFGRRYNAESSAGDGLYSAPFFEKLLETPAFREALRARWKTLKKTLVPEAIISRFESVCAELAACGVWERERARFPDYTDLSTGKTHALDPAGEIENLPAYLTRRAELIEGWIIRLP